MEHSMRQQIVSAFYVMIQKNNTYVTIQHCWISMHRLGFALWLCFKSSCGQSLHVTLTGACKTVSNVVAPIQICKLLTRMDDEETNAKDMLIWKRQDARCSIFNKLMVFIVFACSWEYHLTKLHPNWRKKSPQFLKKTWAVGSEVSSGWQLFCMTFQVFLLNTTHTVQLWYTVYLPTWSYMNGWFWW